MSKNHFHLRFFILFVQNSGFTGHFCPGWQADIKFADMKPDYWNVSDEQVVEKTGKSIAEWIRILDAFQAADKKSNDVVAHLQSTYNVPRYWARALTTLYLKKDHA